MKASENWNENPHENCAEIPDTVLEIIAKRIYEELCEKNLVNVINCN